MINGIPFVDALLYKYVSGQLSGVLLREEGLGEIFTVVDMT